MSTKEEIQNKAADATTDQGTKFKIRVLWFKIRLSIKPQRLGTIILQSKERSKIVQFDSDVTPVKILDGLSDSVKPMARIISLSILNNRVRIFWFNRVLTLLLLWSLKTKELRQLTAVTISQMGIEDFFHTTVLLRSINQLERRGETVTDQPTPSGDESETSVKTSDTASTMSSGE